MLNNSSIVFSMFLEYVEESTLINLVTYFRQIFQFEFYFVGFNVTLKIKKTSGKINLFYVQSIFTNTHIMDCRNDLWGKIGPIGDDRRIIGCTCLYFSSHKQWTHGQFQPCLCHTIPLGQNLFSLGTGF